MYKQLKKQLAFVEKEVDIALKNGIRKIDKSDPLMVFERNCHRQFWQRYNGFATFLNQRTEKCKAMIDDTELLIKKTMQYYGEEYPEKSVDDFFQTIINFIDDFHMYSDQDFDLDDEIIIVDESTVTIQGDPAIDSPMLMPVANSSV
jgi:hypothetical protein